MGQKTHINQLVVPLKFRSLILKLSHEHPLSAHIGINKAKETILRSFYWPNVFHDVAQYIKSCPDCQKVGKIKRTPRAPLMITSTPARPW